MWSTEVKPILTPRRLGSAAIVRIVCEEALTFRRKAPTNTWTAGAVELVDVHRRAVANPVSLSAVAAGDLKIAFRVILRELLGR